MIKFIYFFSIIAALLCTTYGNQLESSRCDCVNPVYIDIPKSIVECSSKKEFLNQITQNVNKVVNILNEAENCNFTEFRNIIFGLRDKTVNIVDAYFSCAQRNCTPAPAVLEAYSNLNAFKFATYHPYLKCSLTTHSPQCGQVLLHSRSAIFNSIENIETTLLKCAELKLNSFRGNVQESSKPINECNCIEVDPQPPIPKTKLECLTTGFTSKLDNFIAINFERIRSEYRKKSSQCGYSGLEGYIEQFAQLAANASRILKKDITEAVANEFNANAQSVYSLIPNYINAANNYIINNQKSCYFTIRKTELTPGEVAVDVLVIGTKFIGYYRNLDNGC